MRGLILCSSTKQFKQKINNNEKKKRKRRCHSILLYGRRKLLFISSFCHFSILPQSSMGLVMH